jgi:hypothetical protein
MEIDGLKLQWKTLIFRTRIALNSAETTRDLTLTDLRGFQTFPAISVPVEVIRANAKEWAQSSLMPFHQTSPPEALQRLQCLFRIAYETFELIDKTKEVLALLEDSSNKKESAKMIKKIREGLKLMAIREWNRGVYTQACCTGTPGPYSHIDPATAAVFCTWTSTPYDARSCYPSFAHACSLVEMFDSIVSEAFIMSTSK